MTSPEAARSGAGTHAGEQKQRRGTGEDGQQT